MIRRALFAAALIGLAPAGPRAQDRPLPDPPAFLAAVRAHMHTDRTLLSQYIYKERKRDVSLNLFGKLSMGAMKVTEVHPGLNPDDTYRRVIEIDGKPRDPKELARDDEKYQKKILEAVAKREHETDADRRKRQADEQKTRREEEATFDDIFRIYLITLIGRETRDSRSMIVVRFEPKPGVKAQTGDGSRLQKMKGRAWVDEKDFELARVEFEVLDDISIGAVLGKLYKGTTTAVERRKINDEVWLPSRAEYDVAGRVLVRRFRVGNMVEFSDYQKFEVGSEQSFKIVK